TQTATSPEAASTGEAPTARKPVSTTADELVYPTRAARMPARTGRPMGSIYRTLAGSFCLQNRSASLGAMDHESRAGDLARLVGDRLRTVRKERGLSVGALAAAADIGKGSLSEIENGARNPTLGTLYALAGALGVPLAALLAARAGTRVASP